MDAVLEDQKAFFIAGTNWSAYKHSGERNRLSRRKCQLSLSPDVSSWFWSPIQAYQAFRPIGVSKLLPNLSGKDKSLNCPLAGHSKSFIAQVN